MTMTLLLVLAWGTLTALDLVAFGQFMIGRPLVAGTVAGYIVGDPAAGALVGGLLELYALETLAVGGARYPDFGPAAVAGAVALAHAPVALALGLAGGLGLVVAWLGEWSIIGLRRSTTRAVRARAAELDAGDRRILVRVHLGGIARDTVRGAVLTAVGLLGAWGIRAYPLLDARPATAVTVAVVGAGLGTALVAAVRLAGRTRRLAWLALGILTGTGWVLL
ncbi:MAG: PTS sugar transporter subunit IIC [Gemmatimonadales bacterium]